MFVIVFYSIFNPEEMPFNGKRKSNNHCEKRGQYAFHRDLRERAECYPDFETEFGHLEGDTGDNIVGKGCKSAVITLVERLSKAIITLKVTGRKASDIEQSIDNWMSHFSSISFNLSSLIVVKNFQIGNHYQTIMISLFSLRIQAVQGNVD